MFHWLQVTVRWSSPTRVAVAAIASVAASAIQLPVTTVVPGEPFLLDYIVVVVCAFTLGRVAALTAATTTSVLCLLFFEPFNSLTLHHATDLVAVQAYFVSSIVSALGLDRLRQDVLLQQAGVDTSRLLLREMSHRVGNDLSIAISMLRQKRRSAGDEAASVIDDMIGQLHVLGGLYRQLNMDTNSMQDVDIEQFMLSVTDALRQINSYARVELVRSVSVRLPMKQAVAVGLLTNEAVTNALKYAFVGRESGRIRIALDNVPTGLRLSIQDDGIGFEETRESTGQGSAISKALAAELGGKLGVRSSSEGTTITVHFPHKAHVPEMATLH